MRRSSGKLACTFMILSLAILLFGCAPAAPSIDPNLVWGITLSKYEVKDKLETVETVQQYVGSYDQVRQQLPAVGNVYLIMKLAVSKQKIASTSPFDWSKLMVQDASGKTYPRVGNDSFLELYKYTPRMTGLELKFGENEGWVCYEIPAQAAQTTLTLVYSGEGSQQTLVVKK